MEKLGPLGVGVAPVGGMHLRILWQEELPWQTISQTLSRSETDVSRQAYQILHFAFTVAPILFGLDKFLNLMTNWDNYLAPWIARIVGNAHTFMLAVGAVEIVAGIVVAFKPRWGSLHRSVVGSWVSSSIS